MALTLCISLLLSEVSLLNGRHLTRWDLTQHKHVLVAATTQRGTHTPGFQGLSLVHLSAQRKHILWDMFGACFPPTLLDRGTRGDVTKTD